MSCCGQSQRAAAQLLEYETIAKDKFPKWDANAKYYYDTIKDKDRDGNIKMHSLDHYLYHTYFYNMREDRLKQVQSDEQSADASAGKLPKAPAAAGNPPKAKIPMARCDNESSDEQCLKQCLKNPLNPKLKEIMQPICRIEKLVLQETDAVTPVSTFLRAWIRFAKLKDSYELNTFVVFRCR
jgi:hypothetical protein